MDNDKRRSVLQYLDSLEIVYQMIEHAPAMTMEDLVEVDRKLGVPHAKNLFLCNRQKASFFLLLMNGNKPFRTAELSRQLEIARLSFAKPEYMQKYLQTSPGALSPMGLLFDTDLQVKLIADRDLLEHDKLCFHPCTNDASLIMSSDDFWETFLKATGHEPTWVSLTGQE